MLSFSIHGARGLGRTLAVVCIAGLFSFVFSACSPEKSAEAPKGEKPSAEAAEEKTAGENGRTELDNLKGMSPEEIVRLYMEASVQGDLDAVPPLMTDKAREASSSWEQSVKVGGDEGESFVVGKAVVEDNLARVPVEVAGPDGGKPPEQLTFRLRKADGRWGIFAFGTLLENGSEFTLDFENMGEIAQKMEAAFQESVSGDSQSERRDAAEQKKSFDALKTVAPERFEEEWKTNPTAENRPVGEVLAELLSPMGVLPPADPAGNLLDTPVAVNLENKSRLESIEALCEQIGYYPAYPYTPEMRHGAMGDFVEAFAESIEGTMENPPESPLANALVLKKGPRPRPVVFFGPLMMEIGEITQNPAYATGRFTLTVFGADIDQGVFELLGEEHDPLAIETAQDKNGNGLLRDTTQGMSFSPYGQGAFFRLDRTVHLKNLLRHAAEIRKFSGKMVFRLPIEIWQSEFKFEKDGEKIAASTGELSADAWRKDKEVFVEFHGPSSLLRSRVAKFDPLDAKGETVSASSVGHNWAISDRDQHPGEVSAQLFLSRPAESVAFKYATTMETVEIPFVAESLALPSPETMPEILPRLEYPGHDLPVSLEFVEVDRSDPYFAKARIRVVNHSNKDISQIDAKFVFLDENEKEANEFPHQLQGTISSEEREVYVGAGETAEKLVTAFFMPENATDIRFGIDRVEFMDASVWKPSEL